MLCFLISTTHCCWAYGQLRLPQAPQAYNLTLPAREAQLAIEIQRVMQPGERYGKPSGLARVLDAPTTSRIHTDDQIYFKLTLPPVLAEQTSVLNVQRGLQLKTTGVLTPILPSAVTSDADDFEAYLQSIGVHYRFDRTGPLQILRAPVAFDRFCAAMNQRFQATLRLGAPANSELANVYVAMLLGRKIELSKAQIERYRMTGTMHFFAISGLHIGVIATVIAQFLLLIRVPRAVAPWIGLPLLYLYVEITGGTPSAIRAFLMAAFFLVELCLPAPTLAVLCADVLRHLSADHRSQSIVEPWLSALLHGGAQYIIIWPTAAPSLNAPLPALSVAAGTRLERSAARFCLVARQSFTNVCHQLLRVASEYPAQRWTVRVRRARCDFTQHAVGLFSRHRHQRRRHLSGLCQQPALWPCGIRQPLGMDGDLPNGSHGNLLCTTPWCHSAQ